MVQVTSLAVFVDFENLALGFKNRSGRFEIDRVLQRLVEKGKIIVKKGYADWSRFAEYKRALHEAGLELIEIPRRAMTGKNSADIHLVVDAMDLSYSKEHIDTFVIVSGDSDFSPLVAKLKENGKQVIGLGIRNSTSELLVSSCDEFIFYEDLETVPQAVELKDVPSNRREVFDLLLETLGALQREGAGPMYASMVKDTMRRKKPSFHESNYDYRTFSDVLEEARDLGLIELRKDDRSGTYVVTDFQSLSHKRTRRGGRRRSGRTTSAAEAPASDQPAASTSESSSSSTSSRSGGTSRRRKSAGSSTRSKKTTTRKRTTRKASPPGNDAAHGPGVAVQPRPRVPDRRRAPGRDRRDPKL
jgi:uncharacterized protein (TIGR00288 family)